MRDTGFSILAAGFNPCKPISFELNRMEQKIEAGAKFAVTQPVIERDEGVNALMKLNIVVVVKAWMSKNIDLLYRSVGKEKDEKA